MITIAATDCWCITILNNIILLHHEHKYFCCIYFVVLWLAKSDNAQYEYTFEYKRTFHADIPCYSIVVVCHSIGFLRNPNTNDNFLLLLFYFFYGYIVSLLGSRYTDSIRTCNINNIPVYNVYVLYYCTRSFVAATSELFVVLVRWLLTDTIASP